MSEKPTPDNKVPAQQLAHDALAAVRAYIKGNHGSLQKITDEANAISGEKLSRHTVGRWLKADIHTFQQPSLGNALLLFEALERVQNAAAAE